jgi:hypothetical protein
MWYLRRLYKGVYRITSATSAKPVLTEDLCVVQKQEFFNSMLYVRNVHLTKGQTHLLVREDVT